MHPYTLYSHFYFSFLKVAHHTRYIALTLTIPVFFLQRWTKFITNHFKEIRELQKSLYLYLHSQSPLFASICKLSYVFAICIVAAGQLVYNCLGTSGSKRSVYQSSYLQHNMILLEVCSQAMVIQSKADCSSAA